MTKRTASILSYTVPFVLVAVFMPWSTTSPAVFGREGLTIIFIGVVVHIALRYGLASFSGPKSNESSQPSNGDAATGHALRSRYWRILKLGIGVCLGIGLACVVLSNSRTLDVKTAFIIATVCQQMTLLGLGYYVCWRADDIAASAAGIICSLALASAAVFFAWSGNIIFQAQRPPVVPTSTDEANALYSLPAVAVILIGLARGFWRRVS